MSLTEWLIVGTVGLWIIYDVYIYFTQGNAATESATTWRFAYTLPSIPWTAGILMGHLFLQDHAPSTSGTSIPAFYGYVQGGVLLVTVVWLIFDLVQYNETQDGCAFSEWLWRITSHMTWVPFVLGIVVGNVFFQMHEATVPTSMLGFLNGFV